jgi:hypothetical protein
MELRGALPATANPPVWRYALVVRCGCGHESIYVEPAACGAYYRCPICGSEHDPPSDNRDGNTSRRY